MTAEKGGRPIGDIVPSTLIWLQDRKVSFEAQQARNRRFGSLVRGAFTDGIALLNSTGILAGTAQTDHVAVPGLTDSYLFLTGNISPDPVTRSVVEIKIAHPGLQPDTLFKLDGRVIKHGTGEVQVLDEGFSLNGKEVLKVDATEKDIANANRAIQLTTLLTELQA